MIFGKTDCDVMVIGCGLAGMAATFFAAERGLQVVQAGLAGGLSLADGLLDLLAVHPAKSAKVRKDPWRALDELRRDLPRHPYAKIAATDIKDAMLRFIRFMDTIGLPYHVTPETNQPVVTAAGTLKPTWAVPESMRPGVTAFLENQRTLVVGIRGLKGFSALQIAQLLKDGWPNLRHAAISLPGFPGEVFGEALARTLDYQRNQHILADAVRPHLKGESAVGFPAVLGIADTGKIVRMLEKALGVRVFEIPVMPPSVTGLRMREALTAALPKLGVTPFYNRKVISAERSREEGFLLTLDSRCVVSAKTVILATGRFLGGGLRADRKRIYETLFHLPVHQPAGRNDWHHRTLFHPGGHRLQAAGIETDDEFRPVNTDGRRLYDNLYAVGTILAHHRWTRQKCGAGLSIATAWKAVKAASE